MRGYRLLLRLLPRAFHRRNSAEMEALFRERLDGSEGPGRVRIWLRGAWDVVGVAGRLHLRGIANASRSFLSALGQDLGFAVRSLWRRPGFALVTAAILSAGIGATTTIFSVVNGVLLRPLDYRDADRIGVLWHRFGMGAQDLPVLHPMDLFDYREWSEAFEAFTLGTGAEVPLSAAGNVRIVQAGAVEAGFFDFFGVTPLLGRTLRPEDDVPGAPAVVVLSHRLWLSLFRGDSAAIGAVVELRGEPARIVGVLPAGFRLEMPSEAIFLKDADLWTAARLARAEPASRTYTVFTAFGRLRPGVDFELGQRDLERMAVRLKAAHPEHAAAGLAPRVIPLRADVVKDARPALLLLFTAVCLMLVVACANAANLLLARGRVRQWELAVRTALGAGRRRVFRLVLLESLLVAGLGGVIGVTATAVSLRAVRALAGESLPRLHALTMDTGVVWFALGVSVAAALLAGVVPAWRSAASRPAGVLGASRRAGGGRSSRFQDGLVLAQVAVSAVLLIGAVLLTRSFVALQRVDPGYATRGVAAFRLALPQDAYPSARSRWTFYQTLRERVQALPGVDGVAAVSQLPLTGSGYLGPYAYDEVTAANWETVSADHRWLAPGYLATLGARLVAGREFTAEDVESGRRLIVVDDRLAEQAFPDGQAVGQRLQLSPNTAPEGSRYGEIIGVVSHLRLHDLARPLLPQIYHPMRFAGRFSGGEHFSVVVRVSGEPGDVAALIRDEVGRLGPGVAFEDMGGLEGLVARARAPARTSLVVMGLFGLGALVLAGVGLYSVLAFSVSERTHEIGIRMALGQDRGSVQRLVVRRGMRLVLPALAMGAVAAMILSRLAEALLFGVRPLDPWAYLTALMVLGLSGLAACWVPARRATRIDPVAALRAD